MPSLKVIISGGGTGGHVFPALAIAKGLEERQKGEVELLFVGARGRMEMERIPQAGYDIVGLRISGFQRKLTWKNLSFPFKLLGSLIKARRIVRRFKPDVVVGVGGYASGPVLYNAAKMGIPTLIQEQNSFPGITNRLLARYVDRICVAFEGMEKFFPKEKLALTGNPVRKDVIELSGKRPRGLEHFGLEEGKPVLLVMGGSLGARTINEGIQAGIEHFKEAGIQVVWQTGKTYYEQCRKTVDASGYEGLKVQAFIERMDLAYAVADLVVSRAGAIAVSELCLIRKPAIFVPSPNVAEDHQTKNAQALVDRKAAAIIPDREAEKRLAGVVLELLQNPEGREQMSRNMAGIALENSADAIVAEVVRLSEK